MTNGMLIKIAKAPDSHEFVLRVNAACYLQGKDPLPDMTTRVAADSNVHPDIVVDEHLGIDTTGVSDQKIINAVAAIFADQGSG